jgi:hypothetical protein
VITLLYVTSIFDPREIVKKLSKGSCEASKRSLQTHAGRHLSNPPSYMYMRDSEGTCFVDSAPMAICMIEASNAFLSLLSALLAHDRLDMTSDVAVSMRRCVHGSKQVDGMAHGRAYMYAQIHHGCNAACKKSVGPYSSSCIYETVHGMACHVGRLVAASTRHLKTWLSRWTTAASRAATARITAATAALVHACLNTTLAL